jgi:tRNA-2-methylthio-N6-dimethylallyladenosine synthase
MTKDKIREDLDRLQAWSMTFRQDTARYPSYYIQTFGCQQNDHDSEIAAGILEESSFVLASDPEEADLVLFNTCSVRANADDRFFGHVGRFKPLKRAGRPMIGVFGCMMEQAIHRQTILSTFSHVDFILGAGAMELLPGALLDLIQHQGQRRKTIDLTKRDRDPFAEAMPLRRERDHRALITIMTGCNNFCSYCIVPYTRGREKSRPWEAILEEAQRSLDQGAVEIMLLGQNVNSYGNDIRSRGGQSPGFPALLKEVSQLESLGILRYMTSHPKDLSRELIQVISNSPLVEPHIHLPLQSGSDQILAKMNRRYTAAHYLELVRQLRESRPGMTITTDLIVGYPGESQADFEATLRVMEEARFDGAFTFIYSPRQGTPAAHIYDAEERGLIQERFEALVKLQNQLSLESNSALVGQAVDVLIDGPSRRDPGILSGRTRDDRLVNFSLDPELAEESDRWRAGRFTRVMLEGAGSFSLEGRALKD